MLQEERTYLDRYGVEMRKRNRRALWVSILALIMVLLAVPDVSAAMSQTVVLAAKYLDWNKMGNRLAIGYQGGRVEVWDTELNTSIFELPAPQPYFFSDLQWSPIDDAILAVARGTPPDGWMSVLVINVETGNTLLTLDGYPFVTSIAWSPDGQLLAAGISPETTETASTRHELRIWDATTGALLHELLAPNATGIVDVTWNPNGSVIAGGTHLGPVLWNYPPPPGSTPLQLANYQVNTLAWDPSGTRLATYSFEDNRTFKIWDTSGATPVIVASGHFSDVTDLDWTMSDNRSLLAIAERSNGVTILDGLTNTVEGSAPYEGKLRAVAWSPDGSQLAFGGRPTDPLGSRVMIVDSAAIMTPPTLLPVPTPADS
ncbi:MAG: hypothetical protein KJ065_18795 [Anaerolineae bacterium]|nr:hypothetical protein [Anaerolineae bacterium]